MSSIPIQFRGDDLVSPRYEVIWERSRAKRWAICVFVINEGEKIRKQVAAMSAYAPLVDVIVADGGSTDGSLDGALMESTGAKALVVKRGPG
ncbi:MAG: glycosyl transferase family 2, partial [Verrucomicrobiales bacterium VVV1]